MRNRFLALMLTTVRSSTWLSRAGLKELADKDQLWILPLAGAGISLLGGFLIYLLVHTYQVLLKVGLMTGNPEILFFYAVMLTWLFLVFLGIAMVMSVLYFSSDIPALIPLPIPPREVIGAKFIVLLLYSYPLCAMTFLPAIYIFSKEIGFSGYLIFSSLTNFILLPVVPTSLAVIFVFLLNRVIRISRYRMLLEVLGNLLLLVVIIAVQLIVPRLLLKGDPQTISQTLLQPGSLFDFVGKLLPPAKWIAISIAGKQSPVLYLVGVFLFNMLLAYMMIAVGERIFYRGFVLHSETTDGLRVDVAHEFSELSKTRLPIYALLSREWAILRSNSMFLFQAFSEVLILPLLLIIYSLAGLRLSEILPASFFNSGWWDLCCGAAAIMMCGITSIFPSSISREGNLFGLSLLLPIKGRLQAISKLLFGLQFSILAFIVNLILLILIFKMTVTSLLYIVPMGLTVLIYFGSVGIVIDIYRPFLTWSHPQQAMKSNLNVLISLGIIALTVVGIGVLAVQFLKVGVQAYQLGILISIIFGALDLAGIYFLVRLSDSKYSSGYEV